MYTLNAGSSSYFYKSKEWRKLLEVLKLERVETYGEYEGELLCAHCGKPIVKAYDCIGHHTIPLTEANVNDPAISLNGELIQLVHHKCHNEIHSRFGSESRKRVYLVYGPPNSGKTTWVHENAGVNDLILDMDSIWQMISVNDRYVKPNRLKQNVFAVRDCLLDMIKMRTGKWQNAYIIGGYPMQMERENMERIYGCEPISIFENEDVCLMRSEGKPDEWKNYVRQWFDNYQTYGGPPAIT